MGLGLVTELVAVFLVLDGSGKVEEAVSVHATGVYSVHGVEGS